jgi:hypothetical protein
MRPATMRRISVDLISFGVPLLLPAWAAGANLYAETRASASQQEEQSLWMVPDKATEVLMTRFHRNLWEKKMGKGDALREARLWLLNDGPHDPKLAVRSGLVRPGPERPEAEAVWPFY